VKTEFVCQNCGARSAKWIGKCQSCGEWNTYTEEVIRKPTERKTAAGSRTTIQKITDIKTKPGNRIQTGTSEFDRILGGGIPPGSVILVGGEPGIGKSTLVLQVLLQLPGLISLYISGEESGEQIRYRAERIGSLHENCLIMSETLLENILEEIPRINPDLIIVDSIQTLYTELITSSAGSISQVRECTSRLLSYAKEHSVPVILIGHINKEGNLAGPKALEHIVDTVLQFEGDRNHFYRLLRVIKNRFGATSEIGIFEMTDKGLKEIINPSEVLCSHFEEALSGTAVSASLEGIRSFLIEVQALVGQATYGTPQRTSTGFDLRRLSMLLAVLEKRAGFHFSSKDVFLNIAGGLKVSDPATDLAVAASILSSMTDIVVPEKTCFAGEIGLSGEIRPVSRIDQRIREAEKMGFAKMFISKYNMKNLSSKKFRLELSGVGKVEDIFQQMFR
jgi:DNA repair protein RadA/Sms